MIAGIYLSRIASISFHFPASSRNEASFECLHSVLRRRGRRGEIAGIGVSARPARVNEEIPEALSLNPFDSN
jgi:hypothetical protein